MLMEKEAEDLKSIQMVLAVHPEPRKMEDNKTTYMLNLCI